jgi:DNA-binding response OmpR family regulator
MARILIVDDDPDIVDACRLFLEREGHSIGEAFSRVEGMAMVGSFDPELIILDVMMDSPDDGFAMAQDLRRQGWKRPILMLTSVANVSGLDFVKNDEMVPVDDFQAKPIEPSVLVQRVAALLASREDRHVDD